MNLNSKRNWLERKCKEKLDAWVVSKNGSRTPLEKVWHSGKQGNYLENKLSSSNLLTRGFQRVRDY